MNPFKTLGHWLWRWWTGREFERKPVAEKPAEASAADFVDSTLPWSVSCRVNDGSGWRTLSSSCRGTAPTETPEQFVRRICPNAKLVPYGQKWRVDFGEEIDERGDTETWNKHHTQEEAWQDAKDELLWYGNDAIKKKIANPLAGLRQHMEGGQQGTMP